MQEETSEDDQELEPVDFTALRSSARRIEALAWVWLIVGGLGASGLAVSLGSSADSTTVGIAAFIGAVLPVLVTAQLLYILPGLIVLLLEIEQNTADSADYTELLQEKTGESSGRRRRRRS